MFLDAETGTHIEELGGMNLFFVYADGHVVTPSLDGNILHGITRDSVITLIKDRGLKLEERLITLDEVREGVNSGTITEIFACGTAAVITPVGQLKSRVETIGAEDAAPGELTVSLREELTGIQYGRVADRHNWLVKLSD
ncbi:MAG: aminotransferase class IV, partial [Actinomycetales bacterium]|nr:aminotransferase class IV [Actinomycetales bacterium]